MIDDVAFRNMSPNTQKVYAYAVANFARFHRQSPDKLGLEHIRNYRLHLMPVYADELIDQLRLVRGESGRLRMSQ